MERKGNGLPAATSVAHEIIRQQRHATHDERIRGSKRRRTRSLRVRIFGLELEHGEDRPRRCALLCPPTGFELPSTKRSTRGTRSRSSRAGATVRPYRSLPLVLVPTQTVSLAGPVDDIRAQRSCWAPRAPLQMSSAVQEIRGPTGQPTRCSRQAA